MNITIIDAILGGSAISLGVILSNLVNHSFISPIVFSVGILICIQFNLGLITRAIPTGAPVLKCVVVYVINILSAILIGVLSIPRLDYYPALNPTFNTAVATGIVIGLVSLSNRYKGQYTTLITMILMWTFVYLKLPHCVVYAYWIPAGVVSMKSFCLVTIGNIIGGLFIRVVNFYISWRESSLYHVL